MFDVISGGWHLVFWCIAALGVSLVSGAVVRQAMAAGGGLLAFIFSLIFLGSRITYSITFLLILFWVLGVSFHA